ncbi:MAG: hypothetical protein M3O92_00300 [Actinomycetota bacterium]|nr:hypothetical protein [Actinomycetota bacterium]
MARRGSAEWRENIAEAKRGKPQTPEHKAAIGKGVSDTAYMKAEMEKYRRRLERGREIERAFADAISRFRR